MIKRSFSTIAPVPELRPWIDGFYIERADEIVSRSRPYHIRPDDSAYVIVREILDGNSARSASRAARTISIVGPRSVYKKTNLKGRALTVLARFRPGALSRLFQTNASDLLDSSFPIEQIAPTTGVRLESRITGDATPCDMVHTIQDILIPLARETQPPDPLVKALVDQSRAMAGSVRIRDFSRASGITSRQVRNRVRTETGLPPKLVTRIHRLEVALRLPHRIRGISAAGMAHAAGFSDQSHMTREFNDLLGTTPARWLQD